MMKFGTFDIESRNWDEFEIMASYDGVDYEEHETISDFMEYIFLSDNTCSTYYAHFGGIFDFLFVFDFLFSENTAYEIGKIITQGKKVLCFEVKNNGKKIKFIDSSGLFPFSLKNLTESFDVKHKKLDADIQNIDSLSRAELKKYLKHDVLGLYECIAKFSDQPYIRDVGLKLTRSGISFDVFKKFFMPSPPEISKKVNEFCRKSYFGGRTEIFKPLIKNKEINCYDINSLYPSVMHDFDYPSKFSHWSNEFDSQSMGIYFCNVTCPDKLNIPLLGTKINGKFIFPTGTFDGRWTSAELKKALELGYTINDIYEGAIFDNGGKMFQKFIKHFYDLRLKTECPVQKIIYKDIMNHLYGRLAIDQEREQVSFERTKGSKIHSVLDYKDYEIRMYSKTVNLKYTYSNCALSSFVTSYARIRLYEYMESINFDAYYCDTDSLFTSSKIPQSNELGKMKLEYQLKEACFLLPKTYAGVDFEGNLISKMKGFPKKNIGHIGYNDFVEALSGDLRMMKAKTNGGLAGLRTAMKKGDILTVLPPSDKQLKSKYDKRTIYFKNGEYFTKPLINEYQLCMI